MYFEAIPAHASEVYGQRFTHVVPAYDIVGMLFDDGSDKLIVQSSASGAMQHDPMSWQVTRTGLVEAPGLEPDCVRMNAALAGWLEGVEPDERERFTDELFDVLQAGGATRLGAADQRTKDLVRELLGAAIGANVESAKDAVVSAAAQAVSRLGA